MCRLPPVMFAPFQIDRSDGMEKVSMPPVRLGYVGCGYMAQRVHLPNLLSIPDCEVVALAEVRQELGKQVQSRLGIPKLYKDHEAMLADPEIEAVAVSA